MTTSSKYCLRAYRRNIIITTKPNPTVEPATTLILSADDGADGVGAEAPEGGNPGASSKGGNPGASAVGDVGTPVGGMAGL